MVRKFICFIFIINMFFSHFFTRELLACFSPFPAEAPAAPEMPVCPSRDGGGEKRSRGCIPELSPSKRQRAVKRRLPPSPWEKNNNSKKKKIKIKITSGFPPSSFYYPYFKYFCAAKEGDPGALGSRSQTPKRPFRDGEFLHETYEDLQRPDRALRGLSAHCGALRGARRKPQTPQI